MSTTSTYGLRQQLFKKHGDEYRKVCQEQGWLQCLERYEHWLRSRSKAATTTSEQVARVPFSQDEFMKAIVKFICADDQVRLYLYSLDDE